jgi:hypothetical protein
VASQATIFPSTAEISSNLTAVVVIPFSPTSIAIRLSTTLFCVGKKEKKVERYYATCSNPSTVLPPAAM